MGAFAVVIAAFVGATAYSESRTSLIDQSAISIATNAAPSIERLSTLRGGIRQLVLAEDGLVDARLTGEAMPATEVTAARASLDRDMREYRALPQYPGEARAWEQARRSVEELDRSLAAVLAIGPGDPAALRAADARFREQVENVASALTASLKINADMAGQLAQQIQTVTFRRRELVFGLDLLCAGATVFTALLVLRLLRRHQRLRRDYEAALERRADEMEAFAGRVAHDVRNVLVPVSLSVSQLARMPLQDAAGRWVATADRGVSRLFALVDGLLAFAKAGAQPVPGAVADVREAIQDAAAASRPIADETGCELRVAAVPDCRVPCSAGVLTSLIGNLVGNAIEHIGDGPTRRVELSACLRGATVRVVVEDTGPGVPDPLRDKIFQPFVKGHPAVPGVGLGLATVRRLADGHGGRAGFDPVPGGGSRFWFELPQAPAAPPDLSPDAASGGGEILVSPRTDQTGLSFLQRDR